MNAIPVVCPEILKTACAVQPKPKFCLVAAPLNPMVQEFWLSPSALYWTDGSNVAPLNPHWWEALANHPAIALASWFHPGNAFFFNDGDWLWGRYREMVPSLRNIWSLRPVREESHLESAASCFENPLSPEQEFLKYHAFSQGIALLTHAISGGIIDSYHSIIRTATEGEQQKALRLLAIAKNLIAAN